MKYTITAIPTRLHLAKELQENLSELGYEGNIHLDKELIGTWKAVKQVLHKVVEQSEPHIILQDDVILCDQFARCQKELAPHLDKYGLISMFNFEYNKSRRGYGCNGEECTGFYGAQGYMITPEFALKAIEVDKLLDQEIAGSRDEVRYCMASIHYNLPMFRVFYSLMDHRTEVESTSGTPAPQASIIVNEETDYIKLNPFLHKSETPHYPEVVISL